MEKLSNNDLKENKLNDDLMTTYIKFVDVDKYNIETKKQVGDSVRIEGKLGQTIALALSVPKKYQAAGNYKIPTKFTFSENHRNVVVIPLEHKKQVENLVFTGKRTISYRKVERDGTVETLSDGMQNLKFEALKITDLLTGKVYYDWKNKLNNYASVTSLVEKGYYANQQETAGKKISIDDLIAKNGEINEKVSVIYRPLGSIIQQDMSGKELGRVKFANNSSDPTQAATMPGPVTPNGYMAISKLPDKFKPVDPGTDIVLTYRQRHENKMRRVIRMITLVYWNGNKKVFPQEVDFVNENGEWKLAPGTKQKWNIVTPDIAEGYYISSVKLPTGEDYPKVIQKNDGEIFAIDGVKPNFDTPNRDVTVFVKPKVHHTYISIVDADSRQQDELKRLELSGRTNEVISINLDNLDLPEGYKIINKESIPRQYHFKAKYNSPIMIFAKKEQDENHSMRIKLY